jgi:hypothetical protein
MLGAAALLEPVVAQALVFEGARAIPDVGFFGIGAKTYYPASIITAIDRMWREHGDMLFTWSLVAHAHLRDCRPSSACGGCSRLKVLQTAQTGRMWSLLALPDAGGQRTGWSLRVQRHDYLLFADQCGVESRYALAMAGRDGRRITPRSPVPTRASGYAATANSNA